MSSIQVNLQEIIPTHNTLRNPENISYWIDFFKKDTRLDQPISLIKASSVCGYFLIDGHHRAVGAYLSKIDFLDEKHIKILDITEKNCKEINRSVNFVTPFDPYKECRIEFWSIKPKLIEMSDDEIYKNKHLYSEPRIIWTLKELSQTL